MRKSALKKGGIVLLGAMALFGTGVLSWADDVEVVNPKAEGVAPWFEGKTDFKAMPDKAVLNAFVKMDITDAVKGTHEADQDYYCSKVDFGKLTEKLLPGISVNFQNLQTPKGQIFGGQFVRLNYADVKNHELVKTSSIFKIGMNESNTEYGLGIYPTVNANA
ncbi:MAG: hypothetical protein LUD46_19300 [Parabacteroides sp.]|nr:hypothetical protein [Parabacteroides sp.]